MCGGSQASREGEDRRFFEDPCRPDKRIFFGKFHEQDIASDTDRAHRVHTPLRGALTQKSPPPTAPHRTPPHLANQLQIQHPPTIPFHPVKIHTPPPFLPTLNLPRRPPPLLPLPLPKWIILLNLHLRHRPSNFPIRRSVRITPVLTIQIHERQRRSERQLLLLLHQRHLHPSPHPYPAFQRVVTSCFPESVVTSSFPHSGPFVLPTLYMDAFAESLQRGQTRCCRSDCNSLLTRKLDEAEDILFYTGRSEKRKRRVR